MRPGVLLRRIGLRRRTLLRRHPRPARGRVSPSLYWFVIARDSYRCIATRFDIAHRCVGRLTFEHVPEAGKNTYGVRAPSNRYHGVAACLGAQQPEGWCATHRTEERAWLEALYGPPPYPEEPDEPETLEAG